jgi:DNA-binding transcriptional ArsR family regulator
MSALTGDVSSAEWFRRVNIIKALSDEARRKILERVKEKLGFTRALEVLDISKGAMHNYLHGLRRVPDEVVYRALRLLDEREFNEIVQGVDRLRVVGIIREDGSIDYLLILQALTLASRDEYLKQALLKFTVENFREDLRKMLGTSLAHVVFKWEPGFEEFLRERKKRRKVLDPETIAYYRSLFMKHLEGKTLSEELVEYVVNHENKWLRNVFRHYIQYLYFLRRIPPETYGWVMGVLKSNFGVSKKEALELLEQIRNDKTLLMTPERLERLEAPRKGVEAEEMVSPERKRYDRATP